jgi:hypothetical protein
MPSKRSKHLVSTISFGQPKVGLSEDLNWLKYQSATNLARTLDLTKKLEKEALTAVIESIGTERFCPFSTDEAAADNPLREMIAEMNIDLDEFEEWDDVDSVSRAINNSLKTGARFFAKTFARNLLKELNVFKEKLQDEAINSPTAQKFNSLSKLLDLSNLEEEILKFSFCCNFQDNLSDYFSRKLNVYALYNRSLLASILDASATELERCFSGKLAAMRLLTFDVRYTDPNLSDLFFDLMRSLRFNAD